MSAAAAARKARVLEALAEAAALGAPCPTNPALALVLGVTETQVTWAVARLKADGAIQVEKRNPLCRRVTVVTLGLTTGWGAPAERRSPFAPPPPFRAAPTGVVPVFLDDDLFVGLGKPVAIARRLPGRIERASSAAWAAEGAW